MESITVRGREIKKNDSVMVYTKRGSGSNYRGMVDKIEADRVYIYVKRYNSNQPHRSSGWYKLNEIKVSARGSVYVRE